MSTPVEEFAAAAREYCAWSEPANPKTAKAAFAHLTRLVDLIRHIPAGSGGESEIPDVSDDEWTRVFKGFTPIPFQYYQSYHDPLDLACDERQMGDVHDDLADIWRDLRSGLIVYDAGDVQAAVFQWRYLFQIHWGRHATGAMYALHCWLADNGDDE